MMGAITDWSGELSKLRSELEAERAREAAADAGIAEVLRSNAELPRQLGLVISRLRNGVSLLQSDASGLSSSLAVTSMLADSVSAKVRDLDLAKGRVVECLQRVEDLQDLKLCTEGVTGAMRAENYEAAAGHVQRFLSLDASLFQGQESRDDENLGASYRILKGAQEELSTLVATKFDEAEAEGDLASMQRFFKLFPLLHQHETGIKKYGAYLRGKVSEAAEKNLATLRAGGEDKGRTNVLFADGLTLLFEGVARVVEVHQPLVQASYGPESMLQLMKILQEECDIQGERIIEEFVRSRQFASKARLVETLSRQPASTERLDPLQLDILLSEVTLLHTRGELYLRFVKKRVGGDIATMPSEHPKKASLQQGLVELVRDCGLGRRMQELIGHYISMELYYMEQSLHKAVEMDARDDSSELTSSMVEDVFFLVRKCVRRSLSSGSVDCVCAMLNNAATLLETAFTAIFRAQLKEGYAVSGSVAEAYITASAAYSSVMSTGKMGPGEGERSRDKFLLALNNAAASERCLADLRSTLEADFGKQFSADESSKAKLEHGLGLLSDVGSKLRDVAKAGLDVLISSAIKSRIRSGMEPFLEYNHEPTEEDFADFEANDPWIQGFMASLDELLHTFQPLLVESIYQDFLIGVSGEVARQVEKYLRMVRYNRLGGLQLDKELRELTGYLSSAAGWVVRERLGRVASIVALLNAESAAEAKELLQGGVGSLTTTEARDWLARRVDISSDQLRSL